MGGYPAAKAVVPGGKAGSVAGAVRVAESALCGKRFGDRSGVSRAEEAKIVFLDTGQREDAFRYMGVFVRI